MMEEMIEIKITCPKGQIMDFREVIDISNILRHSQAMEDLIDMRFDFAGVNMDYYDNEEVLYLKPC